MHRYEPARTFALLAILLLSAPPLLAVGESDVQGFPSWEERLLLQLTNRARVDPDAALADCPPGNCLEHDGACYSATTPLRYRNALNRAARFHSEFLKATGEFQHNSSCSIVLDIDSLFPQSCGGDPSCACDEGTAGHACPGPSCTLASTRVPLFGSSYAGEIIAGNSSASGGFDAWLFEPALNDTCGFQNPVPPDFDLTNGHRWLILTASGSLGYGAAEGDCFGFAFLDCYTGDFGFGQDDAHPLASGIHSPRSGASVEAMASWHDAARGTTAALGEIVVEGQACVSMSLERGTATNGSWAGTISGLSGCTRYYFRFEDGGGNVVTYPETGSLGIGPVGSCEIWTAARPADVCGTGLIFEDGFESGDVGFWE